MFAPGLPPLTIGIELDGEFGLGAAEDPASRQRAMAAFRQAAFLGAEFMRSVWLRVAAQMDIRGGMGGNGATYMQGIQTANVAITDETYSDSTASLTIAVTNTAPHAGIVEEGHAAFSMARAINWGASPRVKMGKNGPYLNIPFRHTAHASEATMVAQGYTSSARRALMPADVTRAARALAATTRHNVGPIHGPPKVSMTGLGTAHVEQGAFRQADRYTWGDRLQRNTSPGIQMGAGGIGIQEHRSAKPVGRDAKGNKLANPAWQNSRWNNLFRTEQRTANGGSQSTYMTIRTITPHSLGWNIPAQPGRFVARRVASVLQSGPVSAELMRIMSEPLEAALGLRLDADGGG